LYPLNPLYFSDAANRLSACSPLIFIPLSQPADPIHIYSDDGNSTVLHYICTGQPVGPLSRILLGLPPGIRPAPNSKERASLLSSLLTLYPEILQLACILNKKGQTPVHCCVNTASVEVLQTLVSFAQRHLGKENSALLLSVPDSLGRTALCIALASQQWEMAFLLLDTGSLSHAGIQASYRIQQSLGGGGGGGNRRNAARVSSVSFVAAGSGTSAVISGALGGVLNKLWDSWGGNADELNSIQRHRSEIIGGDGGGGGEPSSENNLIKEDEPATSSSPPCLRSHSLPSTPTSTALATSSDINNIPMLSFTEKSVPLVSVLGDLSAVQRRQQNQIERVAGLLNISISEAMQVLMKKSWDEAAALSFSSSESSVSPSSSSAGRVGVDKETEPETFKPINEDKREDVTEGYHSAAEEEEMKEINEHETPQRRMTCMVCFEEVVENSATTKSTKYLPCSQDHFTCDICFQGILNSNPQSACCPSDTCRLPLPLKAAEILLPRPKYQRVCQFVAEKYVQTAHDLRWCPAAGCTMCLQLNTGGAAGKIAHTAATLGRGVDAFCSHCTHSSCWSCGETSHEPASCPQARTWEEELAALRAMAKTSNRKWLEVNARKCPGCSAFIQRTGGCNHMTCGCGKHWCWECGRDWSLHNTKTGGFYFCSLVEDGAGQGEAENENSGRSSWLREMWKSVHNVAGEATLHRCLQMQLRHECDQAAVHAVAAYLQDLSSKITTTAFSETPSSSTLNTTSVLLGPEQVGVSRKEAAEMRATEWALVIATACCSAKEEGVFDLKKLKNSAPTTDITTPKLKIDFSALASIIIEAHAILKNSAAPLRALNGGARRKYLVELCEEAERYLALVEPILMDAPYQTEAIGLGRRLVASTSSFSTNNAQQTPQEQQGRGFRGAISCFIQNIKGVSGLNYENRISGVDAHVIVEQAHHIAAMQRQAQELSIGQNVAGLQRAIDGLKDAGRKGLFA
jgi:hypothetical protein